MLTASKGLREIIPEKETRRQDVDGVWDQGILKKYVMSCNVNIACGSLYYAVICSRLLCANVSGFGVGFLWVSGLCLMP